MLSLPISNLCVVINPVIEYIIYSKHSNITNTNNL